MNQHKKSGSIAAGLFTQKSTKEIIIDSPVERKKEVNKDNRKKDAKDIKKVGRPRANDIKNEDELVRVAYYLKPEQRKKVRMKSFENDSDSSSIIRELIDKYL